MKVNVEALMRLAGEATSGPWYVREGGGIVYDAADSIVCESWQGGRDACFIAAASPDVVKALCEEVRRLRATVEAAVSAGLSLEEAYETSHRQLHDYEEWGAEQWGRIQAARTALCAFSDALKGGDHAELDLDALERDINEGEAHPRQLLAILARLRSAEAERDAAQAAERKAHDAIARNDERHAEAVAAVRARAERAERERDEARAERDAAILARDGARDEAWQSEVDGCKRALHEREARIRAEEDHRAAVESLETYEDRIKDIADHVLGIQPPDVATIVLLDVIERRCGEEHIAARQAEAVARDQLALIESGRAALAAEHATALEALRQAESAEARVAELEAKANEVPGLTAALDEARWEVQRIGTTVDELAHLRAVAEAARALVTDNGMPVEALLPAWTRPLVYDVRVKLAALDAAKEGT